MEMDVQDPGEGALPVEPVEMPITRAVEPEAPLMLTDAMCGLACQVRGEPPRV